MENYINNFNNFNKTSVYDFKLGEGGIGDYVKFYMIILTKCMCNNIKLYLKINNLEIEKYIKLKYDFLYISSDEISKLKNVTIEKARHYYHNDKYTGDILLNEIFYFDNIVKLFNKLTKISDLELNSRSYLSKYPNLFNIFFDE